MKSAEVLLVLAFVVVSVCEALNVSNEPTIGDDISVSEAVSEDTNVTKDPLEDATTKSGPDDDSTVTSNTPLEESSNEIVTTVQSVTSSVPTVTQNVTSTSVLNQTATTPSVNQTSPSGGKKRLSTKVDKSKCASLGLTMPDLEGCECYKQKSAGTDTPQGFCYYYECPGNPTTISKVSCEWEKE